MIDWLSPCKPLQVCRNKLLWILWFLCYLNFLISILFICILCLIIIFFISHSVSFSFIIFLISSSIFFTFPFPPFLSYILVSLLILLNIILYNVSLFSHFIASFSSHCLSISILYFIFCSLYRPSFYIFLSLFFVYLHHYPMGWEEFKETNRLVGIIKKRKADIHVRLYHFVETIFSLQETFFF